MPAVREVVYKKKNHICDYGACGKAFARPDTLDRHRKIHRRHEDWEFGCPYEGCKFRSNQKGGLKCHIDVHKGERLPCDYPGCSNTFSDPAGRHRHRKNIHGVNSSMVSDSFPVEGSHKTKAYPIGVLIRAVRLVEHCRSASVEPTTLSTPLLSSGHENGMRPPTPSGLPDKLDTQTGCLSVDRQSQFKNQVFERCTCKWCVSAHGNKQIHSLK